MTTSEQAAELMINAAELVRGDRAKDYGDYLENVVQISSDVGITPVQVCDVMIALKRTRLKHTPTHKDSAIDLVACTALREVVVTALANQRTTNVDAPQLHRHSTMIRSSTKTDSGHFNG